MMRALNRGAVVAVALYSLSACLSPTRFQPADKGGSGGYTVELVAQDHFHIGFAGNSATSRRQVEDDLAYLAAQVTLRNGADYYVIVNDRTSRASVYDPVGYPLPAYPESRVPCCFAFHGMTTHEYTASADIVIFKGSAPANDPAVRDARSVVEEIGPRIKRGEEFSVY